MGFDCAMSLWTLGCPFGDGVMGIPAWRMFLAGPVLRMAYVWTATNPLGDRMRQN